MAAFFLFDSRFEEAKKKNEEVHSNLKEITKQQEKGKSEPAWRKIVEVTQQKETMLRNIAERKMSVIVSGLREDNIRNWQKWNKKEEERVRDLLNKMSEEEEDVFSEDEHYVKLWKYEEGKTRDIKITLKSQYVVRFLLMIVESLSTFIWWRVNPGVVVAGGRVWGSRSVPCLPSAGRHPGGVMGLVLLIH